MACLKELIPKTVKTSRFAQGSYEFWQKTYARELQHKNTPDSWRPFLVGTTPSEVAQLSFALETAYAIVSRLILAKAAADREFPGIRFVPRIHESLNELSIHERLRPANYKEAGADLNTHDVNGALLHKAALFGSTEVVTALLQEGTDPNAQALSGITPLYMSVRSGSAEVVIALLVAGADLNAQDEDGDTPLHMAGRWGTAEIVGMLLEVGADPNARGGGGFTPLHHAASRGNTEVVTALLKAGANPAVRDDDRQLPIDVIDEAVDNQQLRELRELLEWRFH